MPITFDAVIQPAQIKQHVPLRFEVPDQIEQLEITLDYEPHQVDGRSNLLTLTVFDPHRVRGEGHKMEPHQTVTLSLNQATPGYIAGEIPAGEWLIVINTHMVLAPVRYRLQIVWSAGETSAVRAASLPASTAPRGAGWYRGDLHAHTVHSDAHWDVPDLIAYARQQRLDFVTLSDHNTVSGLAQMDSFSAGDLLTLGGLELTTYYGHALALGVRTWIDWRVQASTRTMTGILQEVEAQGGLFIIAHPMALGDPVCTGCDWQYTDVMPGAARCVEIWNSPWDEPGSRNDLALHLWYQWLNQGYRMVATTGSDIHGLPPQVTTYGRDVVYAQALSERAILAAVRQGHLYLSAGPRLELKAQSLNGAVGMMGDCLNSAHAQLTVNWSDVPDGSSLHWITNGEVRQALPCSGAGSAEFPLHGDQWALVELRDARQGMLAITNPIFLGDGWR